MSNMILVPVVIELEAGLGTSMTEVEVVAISESALKAHVLGDDEQLREEAYDAADCWARAVDHASSYGIEQGECGEFYEGGDEEEPVGEPAAVIHGAYNPSVHDDYRAGGGSFMAETGIAEAYANYEAFKKIL